MNSSKCYDICADEVTSLKSVDAVITIHVQLQSQMPV